MQREYLLAMIKELVAIPSVTESEFESAPCEWLYDRLSSLEYFKKNERNLLVVDTPLEGSRHKLKALVARVNAKKETNKTILLIGHFDVVDVKCYGNEEHIAFDADKLGEFFAADRDTLYGRGAMDMKCGVAIETALIEEFARDNSAFDVNIVAVFVGDEENSSAGMRGALPVLFDMKRAGCDFLAAIDTEPGEAGASGFAGPMIFLGTLGKLMPGFYIRGKGSHVGNCYDGFSSVLAASFLVSRAEGNPNIADPSRGTCQPSWLCLDIKNLRETYSVTLPDRTAVYFNCFTTNNAPRQVLRQMKGLAQDALREAAEHTKKSCEALRALGYEGSDFKTPDVFVYTLEELTAAARRRDKDFDAKLRGFIKELPPGDMRERGIKCVDFICGAANAKAPYAVCFFLPPWLPVRTILTNDARDKAVLAAARAVEEECEIKYGLKMTEHEFFAGLCDLSYVGGAISEEDARAYGENMPGWGEIYGVPLKEMLSLGVPVLNIGPSGEFPHKKEERLHLKYSLDILPELLEYAIREIAARIGAVEG